MCKRKQLTSPRQPDRAAYALRCTSMSEKEPAEEVRAQEHAKAISAVFTVYSCTALGMERCSLGKAESGRPICLQNLLPAMKHFSSFSVFTSEENIS